MQKILTLITIITATLPYMSCKKDYIQCDNGELCVKNAGADVIYYSWGSNIYTDSILPGNSAFIDTGPVNTDPSNETKPIFPFMSDHGNYDIQVQSCSDVREIQ